MPTRVATAATLLIVLAGLPHISAGDFPQFRGPAGQGHAEATGLPVTWSTTQNVAWHVPIAGKGWSSPIIQGDRIYLTSAVPRAGGGQDDQSLRAIPRSTPAAARHTTREVRP